MFKYRHICFFFILNKHKLKFCFMLLKLSGIFLLLIILNTLILSFQLILLNHLYFFLLLQNSHQSDNVEIPVVICLFLGDLLLIDQYQQQFTPLFFEQVRSCQRSVSACCEVVVFNLE